MRCASLLPGLALLAAGCAGVRGDWPSLQSRRVELVRLPDPDAPPLPRPVAPAPPPSLLAEADRQLADAEADVRAAEAVLARALVAARGQPAGSLAWGWAQVAQSRLWESCGPVARLRDRLDPPAAETAVLPAAPSPEAAQRIERADALLARCEAGAAQARAVLAW